MPTDTPTLRERAEQLAYQISNEDAGDDEFWQHVGIIEIALGEAIDAAWDGCKRNIVRETEQKIKAEREAVYFDKIHESWIAFSNSLSKGERELVTPERAYGIGYNAATAIAAQQHGQINRQMIAETERRVREECAQIADQQDPIETSEYDQGRNAGMSAAARAIRARAEEKV